MHNNKPIDYRTATKIAWGIIWRTVVTIASVLAIGIGMMVTLGIIRLSELHTP